LVVARARLARERASIPQMVFSEQFTKALPPKGARALQRVVARTLAFLVDALREAAAHGDCRADVPARDLATMVLGTIMANALVRPTLGGDARPSPEQVWSLIEALLRPAVRPGTRTMRRTRR